MTDQPKKILLFCKKGIEPGEEEMIQVSVFGAVVIPSDEEPCQDFIDAAWAAGIQLASYDYQPEQEDPSQWPSSLFSNGKVIADKINRLIMAQFN